MKSFITKNGICVAAMLIISHVGLSQKLSAIGFSANIVRFYTSVATNDKSNPGFSIMYWKGITKQTDLSIRYNGVFSGYSKSSNESDYINEFEASFHVQALDSRHVLSPFISAGTGIGNYGARWSVYSPLGGGIRAKMGSEGYAFLQAAYRISFATNVLDNNMFYSLGITQNLRQPPPPPVVKVLPALPIVEVKDRDHDGVPDSLDECPDQAGLTRFKGCPDTDEDGIPDKYDSCPYLAGIAKYKGCPIPDSDGDGIDDEKDKCPNVPGTVANQGCPEIKKELEENTAPLIELIHFPQSSSHLSGRSMTVLDDIAIRMYSDSLLKLIIRGFADNTGSLLINEKISKARAIAAAEYLVKKGVAGSRMEISWFGDQRPIESNITPAGRMVNRRVELQTQ